MRIPGNFFIRSRPFRTKNGSGLMNPSKAEPNGKGIFKRSPHHASGRRPEAPIRSGCRKVRRPPDENRSLKSRDKNFLKNFTFSIV
nr:hypothetical protein [Bacillaceae bacterium]